MKKTKLFAVIIAIFMTMAIFVGCGGQSIVGEWKFEMDMTNDMNKMLVSEQEMQQYINVDEFKIVFLMEFKNDGTYTLNVDADSLKASLNDIKDIYKDGLEKYMVQSIREQTGVEITKEEILAEYADDIDEMIEKVFGDAADSIVDEFEMVGNYKAINGKLFMTEGLTGDIDEDEERYDEYEIVSDTEIVLTFGEQTEIGDFREWTPKVTLKKTK